MPPEPLPTKEDLFEFETPEPVEQEEAESSRVLEEDTAAQLT